MIEVFEGRNHFTTFGFERDPSLTSNCHILLALLRQPAPSEYQPQILKTANFICEYWRASDNRIRDKWVGIETDRQNRYNLRSSSWGKELTGVVVVIMSVILDF